MCTVYTLSSYFIRNQLVEQDGLERARKATIGIQVTTARDCCAIDIRVKPDLVVSC